ncbi:hypothetical protein [Breznakiella homolactica]|uniref:HEAT repeat domain-containing protein n=1 Tax=Breznakiella homolactica TaxID=2798577 RepID=A0A7T8B9Y5_9SPIR|nr:hypothetical protein [Breznakiella homolactica]QQO08796.1 hypothetical protein JFL75_17985 [Breznakiella homolactica]
MGRKQELSLNLQLAEAISQKDFGCGFYTDAVLKDAAVRRDVVDLTVNHPYIMVYYHGYHILDAAAERNPKLLYPYWQRFTPLLNHKNTYHRQIALVILAHLSRADKDDCFSDILPQYLDLGFDKKILIGVLSVRYLRIVLRNKPQYRDKVIPILLNRKERSKYSERQEALLEYEVLEILEEFYGGLPDRAAADGFIRDRRDSASPKTRKKSRELIKKFRLD